MGKQMIMQYSCDRCPATMSESEFKRTGGASLTVAPLQDKRKKQSADLCGNCVEELMKPITLTKLKEVKQDTPVQEADVA